MICFQAMLNCWKTEYQSIHWKHVKLSLLHISGTCEDEADKGWNKPSHKTVKTILKTRHPTPTNNLTLPALYAQYLLVLQDFTLKTNIYIYTFHSLYLQIISIFPTELFYLAYGEMSCYVVAVLVKTKFVDL